MHALVGSACRVRFFGISEHIRPYAGPMDYPSPMKIFPALMMLTLVVLAALGGMMAFPVPALWLAVLIIAGGPLLIMVLARRSRPPQMEAGEGHGGGEPPDVSISARAPAEARIAEEMDRAAGRWKRQRPYAQKRQAR